MGFPFEQATWDVVTDAMYMGSGGSLPDLFTLIGVVACIVILYLGNKSEKSKYLQHSQNKE